MTTDELKAVLAAHAKWLLGKPTGKRANLRGANLSEANLSEANLRGANLCEANLREANLSEANLRWAHLRETDLCEANLSEADLRGANLCGANLRWANLRETDLRWANLSEANLSEADLRGADLSWADLRGAIDGAICRMDFGGWSICIRSSHTSIGCQTYQNKDWLRWTPENVAHMHVHASAWWQMHGAAVKAAIRVVQRKARPANKKRLS